MSADLLKTVTDIAQILLTPLIIALVGLIMKLYRKIKLIDYKQEALVYALHHETKNGFSEHYHKKLEELIKEDVFINTGKK